MNKATIKRKLRALQQLAQPNRQQLEEQKRLEQLLREKEMENGNPLLSTPTPKNFLDKPYVESDWS
jgi:hypothetical protein